MTSIPTHKYPECQPFYNRVFLEKGQDAYAMTRSILSQMDFSFLKQRRVLLKPNAGRLAPQGKGITTDPQVVAGALDAFLSAGAEVFVGESPIVGVDTFEAFDSTGIAHVVREKGGHLIDLNEGQYVKIAAPQGKAIKAFKICPKVPEFDFIVSIPVMKMHMHTGVSLSIKNMKGCLWRRSKVDLHMLPPLADDDEKPINVAIADMLEVLRPDMALIDGMIALEGLGPSAGTPKPLGMILAGFDPLAVDAVACRLMGLTAESVPHIKIGAQRGYGQIDLDQLSISPPNWQQWITPLERPPENLSIEFPNIVVHDQNSCSACQSTLLLLLKRYRNKIFEYFPPNTEIHFSIGKGNTNTPDHTIHIGNCTAKMGRNGIFIKGCPPVESEIMHKITGNPSVDYMDGRGETPKG